MCVDCVPQIKSADGLLQASVALQGGFCRTLTFYPQPELPQSIFHRAPWLDGEPLPASEPALMSSLGGEWVGIPFGHTDSDDGLFFADAPHGLPANNLWQLIEQTSDSVTLQYTFANDYPLARVQRRIHLDSGGRACFSLTLYPRHNCRMPVGLHPVFPFAGEFGELQISVDDEQGIVYPQDVEAGISQLSPGTQFTSLKEVSRLDGGYQDISRQPLDYISEEIVQLINPNGHVRLTWPQRELAVNFEWDKSILPSCLLWMSNGGRDFAPWNGQNFCLGVEAINSAWDLGPDALRGDTAIDELGVSSALTLYADSPVSFAYQFHCQRTV